MSTPAESLMALLLANASLAAAVGTRVRVDLAEEADGFPFVVMKRASFHKFTGLDGSVHARRDTFQIESWGKDRDSSSAVSDLVDTALRANGLEPDEADPDAIDPEIGARAVVLNVDVWT